MGTDPNNKYAFYINFDTEMFLGAKELLKSMPSFYNGVYFSTKYANALWSGDKEEHFPNVTLLTEAKNMETLRQIIKSNFLYLPKWDSKKYTDKDDYGFSFIAGNIKYILMSFEETETGYIIKSYDVDNGDCFVTNLDCDKRYFLDVSMNEMGELVRTCDFNLEYMSDANTTVERAYKKTGPEMAVYDPNKGSVLVSLIFGLLVLVLSITTVYLAYGFISGAIIK